MEPNIVNVSDKHVKLAWRGFVYEIAPGESKNVSALAYGALMKRFPNELKPYKAINQKSVKGKDAVN